MVGKKAVKKAKKVEEDGGLDLDDAFSDDDDVDYAETKPRKISNKKKDDSELNTESLDIDMERGEGIEVMGKNIEKLKKGDKIKLDGVALEVDAHYVMIDHGTTKEMAIECFDSKKDEDYQIRYFADNVENSIEVYKLDEIIYNRLDNIKKIEW